jgi:uncharacterized phage protein (TIGR01671 family)
MKREIKFRAWDGVRSKMFYNIDIHLLKDGRWAAVSGVLPCIQAGSDNGDLLQHSGFKDRNGKEIYEGDILRKTTKMSMTGSNPKTKMIGSIKKVVFREGAFLMMTSLKSKKYRLNSTMIWYYGLEVVGNIYETPHLLNKRINVN